MVVPIEIIVYYTAVNDCGIQYGLYHWLLLSSTRTSCTSEGLEKVYYIANVICDCGFVLHGYRWLKIHVMPRIGRWFLFGMGYQWIEVTGRLCSVDEVPVLVASPHCTLLDPFLIGMFTLPSVVTRQENRRTPILGSMYS